MNAFEAGGAFVGLIAGAVVGAMLGCFLTHPNNGLAVEAAGVVLFHTTRL
jgi:hypothetical protein